jgi:hypothetical protein
VGTAALGCPGRDAFCRGCAFRSRFHLASPAKILRAIKTVAPADAGGYEVGPARSGTHSPCSCSLSRRRQPRDRRVEGSHNHPMRRFLNRSALFISSLPGLRLCLLAAKSTRWDPRRLSDLLSDLSIQQVAQPRQRATQMHQLQRVSILLLFQVP